MAQAGHTHTTRLPAAYCLLGASEIAHVHARLMAAEMALVEVRALMERPDPILDPEIMVDLAATERSLRAARIASEAELELLGHQAALPIALPGSRGARAGALLDASTAALEALQAHGFGSACTWPEMLAALSRCIGQDAAPTREGLV